MLVGCVKEMLVIREVSTLAKVSIVIKPKKHVARNNFTRLGHALQHW